MFKPEDVTDEMVDAALDQMDGWNDTGSEEVRGMIAAAINARPPCVWKHDEDGAWDTACGERHLFTDGTPAENNARWCCYCGAPLQEASNANA